MNILPGKQSRIVVAIQNSIIVVNCKISCYFTVEPMNILDAACLDGSGGLWNLVFNVTEALTKSGLAFSAPFGNSAAVKLIAIREPTAFIFPSTVRCHNQGKINL